MQRLCFGSQGFGTGAAIMITTFSQSRSAAQKIFDNIIFLGDIFGDREDEEIPDIPVLELAKSFELGYPNEAGLGRK
jgi:hypothetical protein